MSIVVYRNDCISVDYINLKFKKQSEKIKITMKENILKIADPIVRRCSDASLGFKDSGLLGGNQ